MFKNLNGWAIGAAELKLPELVKLASQTGFGGVDFSIDEVAQLAQERGLGRVKDLFASAKVLPGQWGLPFNWLDDKEYAAGLAKLPAQAKLARELGCLRCATWCPPSTNLPYLEAFVWHVARFRPIAKALADEGCRFGIEFVGPKTSRSEGKYEFLYTMEGALDMAGAIGTGNVGLLLDAWHLYSSGGQVADMAKIRAQDVVQVHVNDAPAGVPLAELIDDRRALPTETGVIDLAGFMKALATMGYDGPVTAEPFSARLNAMTDHLAQAQITAEYMARLWQLGGLA